MEKAPNPSAPPTSAASSAASCRETLESGMRRPGETVEQFAERIDGEAKLAHARNGGTQIASGPITQQTSAEVTPLRRDQPR